MCQFCGRNLTVSLHSFYTGTPDDRPNMRTVEAQLATIVIGDGTHSITFTMNANNIIKTLEDSFPWLTSILRP